MSDRCGIITGVLQVCLNGSRNRDEYPGLPVTPEELARAARDAVRAGAQDIHVHPTDADGGNTMDPDCVAAVLTAVRAAVPGIPVGVTTGAWTARDADLRAAQVRAWTVRPDHASVNWHEEGAATVAEALLAAGVGVEAGIWSGTDGIRRFLAWPRARRVLRVLAEVTDTDPLTAPGTAVALLGEVEQLERGDGGHGLPVLLHGEGAGAWPVLAVAVSLRLDTRIGLEDVLHLPDGSPAAGNGSLVAAARRLGA